MASVTKFHPNLGEELRQGNQAIKMQFSQEDKEALLAFFNTLTDDVFLQDERFSDPHN
jgi:cytochrome c peroxidase